MMLHLHLVCEKHFFHNYIIRVCHSKFYVNIFLSNLV